MESESYRRRTEVVDIMPPTGPWYKRSKSLHEWDELYPNPTAMREVLFPKIDPISLYQELDRPDNIADWHLRYTDSIRVFQAAQHLVSVFHARMMPQVISTMEEDFTSIIENFRESSLEVSSPFDIKGSVHCNGLYPEVFLDLVRSGGGALANASEKVYTTALAEQPQLALMFLARAQGFEWGLRTFEHLPERWKEENKKRLPRAITEHTGERLKWPEGYEDKVRAYICGQ
jgi:hypothetical protein